MQGAGGAVTATKLHPSAMMKLAAMGGEASSSRQAAAVPQLPVGHGFGRLSGQTQVQVCLGLQPGPLGQSQIQSSREAKHARNRPALASWSRSILQTVLPGCGACSCLCRGPSAASAWCTPTDEAGWLAVGIKLICTNWPLAEPARTESGEIASKARTGSRRPTSTWKTSHRSPRPNARTWPLVKAHTRRSARRKVSAVHRPSPASRAACLKFMCCESQSQVQMLPSSAQVASTFAGFAPPSS
mmetsp:Transcript_41927/g.121293  ORF Transcript_41927/g.121293 Transcript_41927/m.121293 type:complete len:243 (-) Transcript_41927:212-940(-)